LPEVESVPQAVERARQQIHDGADGIKIFAGSIQSESVLVMPLDIATAIVAEAHRAGKPVFAHPSNNEGIEVALKSGVDVLAHTAPMSGPWTSDLVQRIKAAHMALIPTLTLFEVEGKKFGETPKETAETIRVASQQLKSYSDAGGVAIQRLRPIFPKIRRGTTGERNHGEERKRQEQRERQKQRERQGALP
jgi:hypothetical protein